MKLFKRFLLLCLCAIPTFAQGQIATTAGSNLTAWNGNSGATNNNNWNQLMNNRTMAGGGSGAVADFGNCNSLILRCAQPKCSGCDTLELARPIVAGCVNSNATCKKYGDDLIEFISAQLVSNANNKAQQAEIAAQQMAAQAAAAQSNAQLQQMQQQMQQMQYEMQQQNAQQMAQMQAALDEQKALTAAAMEQATKQPDVSASAPSVSSGGALTDDMVAAAEKGVDADILARKQISGQILSKIENAEIALKKLEATMDTAFSYAGCDSRGNNCAGPKRVKIFKEKAHAFFEPYDEIVDEAYEALEMALAVGVDVSDVIMMLSGACNQWGKFLCTGMQEKGKSDTKHDIAHYEDGKSCKNGRSVKWGYVKGGQECSHGMAVPPQDDSRCTVTQLIGGAGDNDEVLREWLDENYEGDRLVRVGCATSALESIAIFGRRSSKKGATLDLDTLERIILQDAPEYAGANRYSRSNSDADTERLKYCALTPNGYQSLLTAVQSKKLPKNVCVSNEKLAQTWRYGGPVAAGMFAGTGATSNIIPGVLEEYVCKNWGNLAPSAGVKWKKVNDSDKYERCVITNGDYVYAAGGVLKKVEYEKIKNEENTDVKNKTDYEGLQSRLIECNGVRGYYNPNDAKCYCDTDMKKYIVEPQIQKCENGTPVKK